MRRSPGLAVVHVVVPARNEERLLPRHLAAMEAAIAAVRRTRPGLVVRATVVLDSCTDRSAELVARHPGFDAVPVVSGIVGAVRARGVQHARECAAGVEHARVWVANTDADTFVPEQWLVRQVELAEQGQQLVVGTVVPAADDLAPGVLATWLRQHHLVEGHPHVHGANLGFTLAAHDAVGGFAPVATGEDVDLVARMRAQGLAWRSTTRIQVTTSGRTVSRAPAGFAAYLLALAARAG